MMLARLGDVLSKGKDHNGSMDDKQKTTAGEWIGVGVFGLMFFSAPLLLLWMLLSTAFTSLSTFFFDPIEMKRSKEDVQGCAVIASNLASGDNIQERLFDVCLKKGWNE